MTEKMKYNFAFHQITSNPKYLFSNHRPISPLIIKTLLLFNVQNVVYVLMDLPKVNHLWIDLMVKNET